MGVATRMRKATVHTTTAGESTRPPVRELWQTMPVPRGPLRPLFPRLPSGVQDPAPGSASYSEQQALPEEADGRNGS